MKITEKRYKCERCGHETRQKTNHYGPTWSFGHYSTCPSCPPWAKYSEFGGNTTWICQETPNKAKHRQDLQVKLSPERLARLESICQHNPNKAIQVCNAGDWPDHLPESFGDWLQQNGDAIEITMPLDRTEATCLWFDNKAKNEGSPFA